MKDFRCYTISKKRIICDISPAEINKENGTAYFIKLSGIEKKSIKGINVEIDNSNSLKNLWNNFRKLVWQGKG